MYMNKLKSVSEMSFARTENQLPADADPTHWGTRFCSPYSQSPGLEHIHNNMYARSGLLMV
jgi:hypothetical protein